MSLDPKTLDRFSRWLLARYSPRTARKYRADAIACVKYDGNPPHSRLRAQRLRDYRLAWDVWQAWGGAGELPVARPVVPDRADWNKGANKKLRGGRRSGEKRLRSAVSFDREDYLNLVEAAEADENPAAAVLLVIARTGLRVGDVLRAPVGDLRAAMKRDDGVVRLVTKGAKETAYSVRGGGAAERAWTGLLDAFRRAPSGWVVAEALMETPGASPEAGQGAYERVRRTLDRLGKAAGAGGRIHIHRFRTSVAVFLSADGATEDQVRKVLVHSSVSQTRKYATEGRALESAQLLAKLERKR